MQLLYATQNNSKIYNMKRRLKDLPIDLVPPKDLNLKLEILEDGESPKENALKKACAYFKQTRSRRLVLIPDFISIVYLNKNNRVYSFGELKEKS